MLKHVALIAAVGSSLLLVGCSRQDESRAMLCPPGAPCAFKKAASSSSKAASKPAQKITKEQQKQVEKQKQQETKKKKDEEQASQGIQLCTVVADSFCNGKMANYSCIRAMNGTYSRMRTWEAQLVCIAHSPVKAGFCRVMTDQKAVCGQACKSGEKCIAAFSQGGGMTSACVPDQSAKKCDD